MTGEIDQALGQLNSLIMEASSSQAQASTDATAVSAPAAPASNGVQAPIGTGMPMYAQACLDTMQQGSSGVQFSRMA